MAARRNKNQARRNSGNGTPGWVWLIAGLVLGAAAFFIVPGLMKKDGDGFFRPQPNPDALPAQVADADDSAAETSTATSQPDAKADDSATKETRYDFYTLLPAKEVQMSDAELAASARAEQASAARAQKAAAAATPSDGDNPTPIAETPSPAPTSAATTTIAATAAATTAAPASDARYILQAGAFGASGDAESTKAKIALLGLSARVESAQIGAKTVYRVRMGPYGTASELAEAKQKLANGGLPAMAIKAR